MEENNAELFDYFAVVWKRKILIIVVTLVCIGVGVGVISSRSKPPPVVTYTADAVVKIGKKVRMLSYSGMSTNSVVEYIKDPGQLVEIIPLKYGSKVIPGHHLDVVRVGTLAVLRLSLTGPDKGVVGALKELVDVLVDEHRKQAKDSVVAYNHFMKQLEADSKMLKKDIVATEASLAGMKRSQGEFLISMGAPGTGEKEVSDGGGDRSAFLNMLYLKTIDKEKELSSSRKDLRNIQGQLIMHQITLGNLEEYKTELVGGIRSSSIESKKEVHRSHTIVVAVVAGLMLSLFIAFFWEYIEESKSRRKEKE